MPHNHDPLLPLDDNADENGQANFALPYSQAEIDDLLYSDELPDNQRLEQLKAIRAELSGWEADDVGEDDPAALLGAIDDAIARLSARQDRDGVPYDGGDILEADPLDHSEILSPDDDALLALEDSDIIEDDDDDEAERWDPENEGHDGRFGHH